MKLQIPEKITTVFANLDEKNRYYVFCGILVFVFLLDYLLLMRPQLGTLAKLNPEVNILAEDIHKAKTEIKNIDIYKNQIEQTKVKVDEANRKVMPRTEVPVVLETISRIANKTDIKIDQIMPKPTEQKMLLDKKERKYYSLPILVEGRGGYHNFGQFLFELETQGLFLRIGSFTIASVGESKNHNIKLTLEAIIFEESQLTEKK